METLHISENIIRLRRQKGITQDELARFVGVTKASISKWETGQSMPDILLLPQLASYFGVTVDALLGYEPQMSREQIRTCYHRLAADFATRPFEEVMEECNSLVKKYYSCYHFLTQMCVLWLNHFMMAENPERGKEILGTIVELCNHVLDNSKDILLCNNVVSIRSLAELQRGNAVRVIEDLEDMIDVNRMEGKIALLVQAYLMAGKTEEADKAAQIYLYQEVLGTLNGGIHLLSIHIKNWERCEEIMKRMDTLVEAFHLEQLNPNLVANYQLQAAMTCCANEKEEQVYNHLESYADAVACLFQSEIILHGDDFFPVLDSWYENLELGSAAVRDKKLIADSAMQALEYPGFLDLLKKARLEKIKKRVDKACHGEEEGE